MTDTKKKTKRNHKARGDKFAKAMQRVDKRTLRYPDHRGGGPSKYKDEYCDELIEHMTAGFSFESFAGKLGIAIKTLYNWESRHEEFFRAKMIGRAGGLYFYEKAMLEGLWFDPEKGKNLNTNLFRLIMRSRYPKQWAEKYQIDIEAKIAADMEKIKDMSPAEIKAAAREAERYLDEQLDEKNPPAVIDVEVN